MDSVYFYTALRGTDVVAVVIGRSENQPESRAKLHNEAHRTVLLRMINTVFEARGRVLLNGKWHITSCRAVAHRNYRPRNLDK